MLANKHPAVKSHRPHSDAEVALLRRPPRHYHLPLRSGCHANLLQPRSGPNTASSLAALVTRGYFKRSLSVSPFHSLTCITTSTTLPHPPLPSPVSWYSRCFKHFSTTAPC